VLRTSKTILHYRKQGDTLARIRAERAAGLRNPGAAQPRGPCNDPWAKGGYNHRPIPDRGRGGVRGGLNGRRMSQPHAPPPTPTRPADGHY